MTNKREENLYSLDGIIPLRKAIPLGLQHILAMFVSNITPILILTGLCAANGKMAAADSVFLVQNAMIVAGIGTLIQLYPVWRIGARLPIVMGISFTFLSVASTVAVKSGYGVLMGAVLVGGLVEGTLGLFAKYWKKVISPLVASTVVIGIGFSLLAAGARSFAGGNSAVDFGSAASWVTGSVTLLTCLIAGFFGKGYIKRISMLFGLIAGYITALLFGIIDFSPVANAKIIALPHFMPYSLEFELGPIIAVTVIFLVSATETTGDTSAVCQLGLDREVTDKELSGSIACDGFMSAVSSLFGCTPVTSFSQNVGLVQLTKVVNRFAIATGAVIMILAGIFPVVGAALCTIPQSVLGGCTIMMFGAIVLGGLSMFAKCGFSERNVTIAGIAISIGLGFTQVPEMFHIFPEIIQTVFAENCVSVIFVLALVLDLLLPGKKQETEKR